MDNLKDKIVTIVDNGASVELAILFVPFFKKVNYFCEWRFIGLPDTRLLFIGQNIPGVTRIDNTDDYEDETDLFVFTDVFYGAMQERLRKKGKLVYGSGLGEQMETQRIKMKELLTALGLPVAPYVVKKGIDKLSPYLEDKTDKWIKVEQLRGAAESWHFESFEINEPELHSLADDIIMKVLLNQVVEDPLDEEGMVEIGCDPYTARGKFPKKILCGLELKDCAYLSRMVDYNKAPKDITSVNDALSETFAGFNYLGGFSTEIRVGEKHTPHLTDFTARNGFPPSFTQMYAWKNLAMIYYKIASGEMIEPEFEDEYYCELIMKSEWVKEKPLAVYIPDKYRKNVKLKYMVMINGIPYILPQFIPVEEFGSIVTSGRSPEDAAEKAKAIAKEIKAIDIKFPIDKIDKGFGEIKKLDKLGINFFA